VLLEDKPKFLLFRDATDFLLDPLTERGVFNLSDKIIQRRHVRISFPRQFGSILPGQQRQRKHGRRNRSDYNPKSRFSPHATPSAFSVGRDFKSAPAALRRMRLGERLMANKNACLVIPSPD
jgi:hypothetical protein